MKTAEPTLLAIDQGTTSTRAILFSRQGKVLAMAQKELALHLPKEGWVEQDANAILNDTLAVARQTLASELAANVVGLGITNQRETTILWDAKTGKPIHNAIVWQDRRTAEICHQLKAAGHETLVSQQTGLLLDPYFCATKIAWLLDNVEGARAKAEAGEILFGTVESYLVWHLSGGTQHVTDASNASRTLLFNIHQQCWSKQLLALFNIPEAILPIVVDNAADLGVTHASCFKQPLPIAAMIGDQQAALVGQACFKAGSSKSTYGTGCFMLLHTGEQALQSQNRLLTTVAYRIANKVCYASEGAIFVAGSAVQWLRDGLKLIEHASETEDIANSLEDNGGVYFVPALAGLGAPYWQPEARGLLSGMTLGTTQAHIVRAALEAQAYQTKDLIEAMCADGAARPSLLRVDGGLVANQFVCQFLADILQVSVEVPAVTEATAWGAASLAGLQVGLYHSLDEIADCWVVAKRFGPKISAEQAEKLYNNWQQAVKRTLL